MNSVRWHDNSTDFMERYEMSLRGARGVVIRQRNDEVGYSAYMGYAGRQQWAEQLFGNVQEAQIWCERMLVARTSYEGSTDAFREDAQYGQRLTDDSGRTVLT